MIKVNINKNKIIISGHANFDNVGKDIVCASVSSIIYTSINAILSINENAIKFEDKKDLIIEIISNDNITKKLIENMILLLKELEKEYPKNIKISKGE
jgi:hypothetical protein